MNENAIRREIVEIGKRLFQKDFVAANDGNISAKVSDTEIIITPTGVSKGFMNPQDLIRVRISDEKVVGGRLKPSSELRMHLAVYKCRPDVNAVVHAHPPTATGFSVAGITFDQIALPEAVLGLGHIALTDYATPTTEQVPKVVIEKILCSDALLLANHGALTVGKTITQAYYRMETLEQVAKITLVAKLLGNENLLTHDQKQELFEIREKMGLRNECLSCSNCGGCDGITLGTTKDGVEQSAKVTTSVNDIEQIVELVYKEVETRLRRGRK